MPALYRAARRFDQPGLSIAGNGMLPKSSGMINVRSGLVIVVRGNASADVMALRNKTNAPIMECKAALAEAGHTAVIKPMPLRQAVAGGFTLDDFTVDVLSSIDEIEGAAYDALHRDCRNRGARPPLEGAAGAVFIVVSCISNGTGPMMRPARERQAFATLMTRACVMLLRPSTPNSTPQPEDFTPPKGTIGWTMPCWLIQTVPASSCRAMRSGCCSARSTARGYPLRRRARLMQAARA